MYWFIIGRNCKCSHSSQSHDQRNYGLKLHETTYWFSCLNRALSHFRTSDIHSMDKSFRNFHVNLIKIWQFSGKCSVCSVFRSMSLRNSAHLKISMCKFSKFPWFHLRILKERCMFSVNSADYYLNIEIQLEHSHLAQSTNLDCKM